MSDTLDMKAFGPNTFGLMKQSRKSAKVAEIELSDDEEDQDDQENDLTEKEFDDFIQQSISNPMNDATVTPPVVTERESDTMVQSSIPTPKQMDALIEPPQTVLVTIEPPSESDPEDSAYALLLKKRTRRDPRP
uniref:Uncharacterized protein n=1 Tax=Lactuca sativa TaxID=4236 RepID=A0A9R1XM69_LACSA|nr:hypothetical protein LSAT_V11C300151310 [Lactuca sativa]